LADLTDVIAIIVSPFWCRLTQVVRGKNGR